MSKFGKSYSMVYLHVCYKYAKTENPQDEPPQGKTNNLHMREQRRRSPSG